MRWLRSMSRFAPSAPRKNRTNGRANFLGRFQPRLESLEERWVPTTVTNLNDSGLDSLRYAIQFTENGGTIDFAPGLEGTITLFTGRLTIEKDLTIVGPGADKIAINGNNNFQVFFIAGAEVSISGLTITNGLASSPPAPYDVFFTLTGNPIPVAGGGIFNLAGEVTINDCVITANQAPVLGSFGAGIYNWSLPAQQPIIGSVTFNDSVITGNVANSSSGGGIFNEYVFDYLSGFSAQSELTLNNTQVISNTGTDLNGGGIYNEGILTSVDSSVSSNITLLAFTPGLGAGIYNSGFATIDQSIIAGNSGPSNGGGIYTTANPEPLAPLSTLTVTNTTIAANRAPNSDGGGIWNNGSLIDITNATITGNEAGRGGGMFLTLGSVPQITLRNTIVAQNTVSVSGPDVQGQVQNAFNNLIGIGNGSAGLVDGVNGNQVGDNFTPINPLLGTLKDNGGPTLTTALLPGSPAIDAGTNTGAPTDDQRGFNRPVNTITDIGAFEYQPAETQTVLVSNNNPSILGQSVTFTATVSATAPNSNVPEGLVAFKDGGVTLGTVALINGVANFSTSSLTLGHHNITAAYQGFVEGDYVLDPSVSNTVDQLVRAGTTTTLTSSINPANTENPITFTATVAGMPGQTPAGRVDFFQDGNFIGFADLDNNGVASLSFGAFAFDPGSFDITAQYLGSETYAPSDSNSVIQVIGATTTAAVLSANPVNVVDPVTITATVSKVAPGSQTPTGNVIFKDNGVPFATVPLNGAAQASTTSTFSKGTHTITAEYVGDSEFTGSESSPTDLIVGATVTFFTSAPNPSDVGQLVLLEAVAEPLVGNNPDPSGFIEFFDGAASLGTAPIVGASAQLFVSFNVVGNHLLTAVYLGDANFTSSVSEPIVQVVGANTVFLDVSPNPSSVNQPITFTATVVPDTGVQTPTGTITFKAEEVSLGTVTLSGGTAQLIISNLRAGTYRLTAEYSGDSNYAPSRSGVKFQTVNPTATSSVLTVSSQQTTFGEPVTFTATVTPSITGPLSPTGTVTFFDRTTEIATVPLNGAGVAIFSTNTLSTGVRYVTARYNGDNNFVTSTSNEIIQLVQPISFFAVGGAPGKVRFYNPDNTLVVDFAPFGAFTGAINVAVADVNGDGYQDLVAAAADGNPDVRVYSGKSLSENPGNPNAALLVQFFAYGINFNVGANVAVGDVNDDGFADVVTGASAGNPNVRVFSGKDIAQGTFDPAGSSLLASWFAYGLQFNVGAKVAVGDVNGDGYSDVTTGASAGNPNVKVYDGEDIALGTFNPDGASLLASWFAYGINFNVGANVAVGDVNGDGYGDVVTGATIGNPHVRVYSGRDIALGIFNPDGASLLSEFFAYDLAFNIGVTVGAADFDGDGDAEIITGAASGAPHYRVVAGNATGVKPPAIFEGFATGIDGGITVGATSLFLPPV